METAIKPATITVEPEIDSLFIARALGNMNYGDALLLQQEAFDALIADKVNGTFAAENILFTVEHLPVYTLGKSGNAEHLLRSASSLGAEFFKASRGGDITFHGPGQLVAYPVFDLDRFGIGLAQFAHRLEQAVINTLLMFGVEGSRLKGASGVWIEPETNDARKICAIGIKASRYVCMHGLALNVNTDLRWFNHIVPCGIPDKGVTSVAKELNESISFADVEREFVKQMQIQFPAR